MNLFAKAREWLGEKMQQAAGVGELSYTRGAEAITLEPWVGRTVFSSNTLNGARVQWGDRDYLIRVSELSLGEPQEGDRIAETIEGVDCVFEVRTPDTGEPAWRFADPGRTMYRLHVKRVA